MKTYHATSNQVLKEIIMGEGDYAGIFTCENVSLTANGDYGDYVYQPTSTYFPHYKSNLFGQQEYMKMMLDPNTIYEQKLPLNTVLFCCNHLPSVELLSFKDFYGAA